MTTEAVAAAKAEIQAFNDGVKADLAAMYPDLVADLNEFCDKIASMTAVDDPQMASVKALVAAMRVSVTSQMASTLENFLTPPAE